MAAVIDIRNLSFAYERQKVLCGVDLSVDPRTTLGLIGPNGGGKTTLVKLLLGLLKPDSGEIRVAGLSPAQAVSRGNIVGYVPQNPTFEQRFPISLRQLVRLGLAGKTGLFRSHTAGDVEFVETLLRLVGIKDVADNPVAEVSGGQLQRAFIARALAPRPKILVLDEPTTGIDPRGQRDFVQLIQQLKNDLGLTVIFVSHDLRAVTSISDRVACLSMHLHYHDTPNHLPAELVYNMFACDLHAMGIGDPHHTCAIHKPLLAADERR
ncbi:MAG: metal ABC transporter ATP-binding protein [Burkholderiales bacterium]|nr:metal ABC transporter ATP-binding protein [Phycisphaerae bacterium]